MLKSMKKKEILDKLDKLKKITGNQDMELRYMPDLQQYPLKVCRSIFKDDFRVYISSFITFYKMNKYLWIFAGTRISTEILIQLSMIRGCRRYFRIMILQGYLERYITHRHRENTFISYTINIHKRFNKITKFSL